MPFASSYHGEHFVASGLRFLLDRQTEALDPCSAGGSALPTAHSGCTRAKGSCSRTTPDCSQRTSVQMWNQAAPPRSHRPLAEPNHPHPSAPCIRGSPSHHPSPGYGSAEHTGRRNQPKVPDQRQGLVWRTPGCLHPMPVNSPRPVPSLLGHCCRAQPAPLLSEMGLPHHRAQPLRAQQPADIQGRPEIRKKLYLQRKY